MVSFALLLLYCDSEGLLFFLLLLYRVCYSAAEGESKDRDKQVHRPASLAKPKSKKVVRAFTGAFTVLTLLASFLGWEAKLFPFIVYKATIPSMRGLLPTTVIRSFFCEHISSPGEDGSLHQICL